MVFGLGGKPKTYVNPPDKFWSLGDLKISTSPDVGLEDHLDEMIVRGTVTIDNKSVPYQLHLKKEGFYDAGWIYRVSSDDVGVKNQVEAQIKGLIGGQDFPMGQEHFLKPTRKPSSSELIAAIVQYVGRSRVEISPKFSDVPKTTYKNAKAKKLELQEVA